METARIRTEVDLKCFNQRVRIEGDMSVSNLDEKYVYKVSHNNVFYVLKGYKIQIEHLIPGNRASADSFKNNIIIISEVFQEYFFARIASVFNPHFAKPLLLDYIIQLAENKFSASYMYIEIIFEYAGTGLDKLGPITFNDAYNFMRQSANALTLLHEIGMVHFDIKPANMVYDKSSDILKIIDMESAFGAVTKRKVTETIRTFSGEIRSVTPEYSPPEVLRRIEGREIPNLEMSLDAIDVYCWGMCFYSMLLKKTAANLRRDNERYKLRLEEDYKDYIELTEGSLNLINVKDSPENEIKNKVKDLLLCALSYNPTLRPKMKILVDDMKKFEVQKNIKIKYIQTEAKNNRELMKKLISNENDLNTKDAGKKGLEEEKELKKKERIEPEYKKYDKTMEKEDLGLPFYAKDNEMRAILYSDLKTNNSNYNLMDICFVCATTKSMDRYITEIKNSLTYVLNLADKEMIIQPRVAFIEYKGKGDKYQIKSKEFTTEYKEMTEFIKGIKCEDGGNGCVDIVTPLREALKLDWSSDFNYVYLIADAPPHGRSYHTDKYSDDYPEDDKYKVLEKLASHYRRSKIILTIIKCNDSVDEMIKILDEHYDSPANKLNVINLGSNLEKDFKEYFSRDLTIAYGDFISKNWNRNFRRISRGGFQLEEIEAEYEMVFETSFRGKVHTGSVTGLAFDKKKYKYSIELMSSAEVECKISGSRIGFGVFTEYFPFYLDKSTNYVAKIPKIAATKAEDLVPYIEVTLLAKVLADKFNYLLKNAGKKDKGNQIEYNLVQVAPLTIIENLDSKKSKRPRFFLVQQVFHGEYVKFNNNYGWKNKAVNFCNLMAQAFSHFTYEYTMGTIMVTDVQGISGPGGIIILNPAIHSFLYKEQFGETNCGKLGMIRFFMTHECNDYCKMLHLMNPNSIYYDTVQSIEEKRREKEALNYLYKEFESNIKDWRKRIQSFDPNLDPEPNPIEEELDEDY